MTTTSRGLQPPYSYPAQASTSAAPIPSNNHARTRLDPPPPFLPPLPSTSSSAYPPSTPSQRPRERGESTPVHSRHREPSFPGTEALSTGAGAGRRKSSSTTPRRTLEGREETREERRVRKERERARREPGFEEGEGAASSSGLSLPAANACRLQYHQTLVDNGALPHPPLASLCLHPRRPPLSALTPPHLPPPNPSSPSLSNAPNPPSSSIQPTTSLQRLRRTLRACGCSRR